MVEIKSSWKSVTDKQTWAARGASFVAKTKATKAVWFPPKPGKSGKKAASAAKRQTRKTTKRTTGAAKKATNSSKR
jgi:hypothetical protein